MKPLLLDQNFSPRLAQCLVDIYPNSLHIQDFGLGTATDQEVLDFAMRSGYTLVVKGAEFYEIAKQNGLSSSMIWISEKNRSTNDIEQILRDSWKSILASSEEHLPGLDVNAFELDSMMSAHMAANERERQAYLEGKPCMVAIYGDYWEIGPLTDPRHFVQLLQAVAPYEDAVLCVEAHADRLPEEVLQFYLKNRLPDPPKVRNGTLYPPCQFFHIPMTTGNLDVFLSFVGREKRIWTTWIGDHVSVYRGNTMLIEFPDFLDNSVSVSMQVPEQVILKFCCDTGLPCEAVHPDMDIQSIESSQ